MNVNKTFGKNVTYDDVKTKLKSKNKTLHFLQTYFLKYIFRVKLWIFLKKL